MRSSLGPYAQKGMRLDPAPEALLIVLTNASLHRKYLFREIPQAIGAREKMDTLVDSSSRNQEQKLPPAGGSERQDTLCDGDVDDIGSAGISAQGLRSIGDVSAYQNAFFRHSWTIRVYHRETT